MAAVGSLVTTQPSYIGLQAFVGPSDAAHQTLVNYATAASFAVAIGNAITRQVPVSTPNFSLPLLTLFPDCQAPQFVCIMDITNPGVGFNFSTVTATGKFAVQPGGFVCYTANTALTNLFVDNTSATSILVLEIAVMSN